MNVNLTFLTIAFVICVVNGTLLPHDPNYCYSSGDPQNFLAKFSTITQYDAVKGGSALNPSSCEPIKLLALVRHGTRRPTSTEINFMLKNYSLIPGEIIDNINLGTTMLCEDDANTLKEWQFDSNLLYPSGGLSLYGIEEMKNIAQRLKNTFRTLFLNSNSTLFRHSPSERTRQSAKAFAEGLYGSYAEVTFTNSGSEPDMLLQSFENCATWKYTLQPLAIMDADNFTIGQEFVNLEEHVNKKLGFTTGLKRLNRLDILALVLHCMYEQILNRTQNSPFCAAFSPSDMQITEYYLDLLQFYLSGYGFPLYKNLYRNMNCELVKNMLDFLTGTATENERLFFGHDTTMQFLFVALGVFKDDYPMTANNFAQQSFRKWRPSLNTPMAATLVIVRYRCPAGDEDEVLLELNELPLKFPGCNAEGICKLSVFLKKLDYFAKANCAKLFCTNKTS
ncbi:multiple inositol polyphosphate phosphatase 1-like isoform X1 [Bradysia coprophila]|uniref:multiple inositol polyphosphate phosphatase 1-like isoform X1 n=1 Tax=Bradysia coprophila TaxID=38358 RepID=UPI00187D904A|nr:multiple inositol polyphosphate phosphatase 1-like isoform X1 [Bradysia coprophila]